MCSSGGRSLPNDATLLVPQPRSLLVGFCVEFEQVRTETLLCKQIPCNKAELKKKAWELLNSASLLTLPFLVFGDPLRWLHGHEMPSGPTCQASGDVTNSCHEKLAEVRPKVAQKSTSITDEGCEQVHLAGRLRKGFLM